MLIRSRNLTGLRKRVAGKIGLIIIITILLSFTIFFRYILHVFTFEYVETDFDLIVEGFSKKQIAEIQNLPFIDDVFPVRLLSGEAEFAGRTTTPLDIYAADSFDRRDISFFTDRLLIRVREKPLKIFK